MTLRDQKQKEFADIWLQTRFGILYLCPRFGKIKTSLYIMEEMEHPKTLIIHPLETIRKSWEDDFVKWGYNPDNVTYCTTASLWKLAEIPDRYDLIIADEIHMFSPAQLDELGRIIAAGNNWVLGLSGTISGQTAYEIRQKTFLEITAQYDIETAIKDKVITDYEITVVLTDLDKVTKYIQPSKKKQFFLTEYARYAWLTMQIDKIRAEADLIKDRIQAGELLEWPKVKDLLGLLPIHRMHVLKKSLAKLNVTKQLLAKAIMRRERTLIFCGVTEIADSLDIPVFHSKNKDLEVRDNFCAGKGDFLATVDMFEAGVTVKPISQAIINSFDSNPENLAQRVSRLTGYEYDNESKVAKIFIICTNTIEREWLDKALEFFDLSKVKYVNKGDL